LADTKRPNILKALSALAKFTGCYEDWKLLLKNYGLSWVGRNGSDIFIERISQEGGPDVIWNWVKLVKEARPELVDLLDLMAVSGLRFVEGINSNNLIIKLNDEDKLGSYWKPESTTLEHFRFKEIFIRNTKKAFVSFVPENLVNDICDSSKLLTTDQVKKLIQKRGLPLRFGDIREAHGTFMTKFLKESEINFLHGRVTSSVFMSNYFNPSLIADLKARVFQGIVEIQEKVRV
jgi:intergrase/recombinase